MGASGKQQTFFEEARRLLLQIPTGKMETSLPLSVGCDDQQRYLPGSGRNIWQWDKNRSVLHRKRIKIISYFCCLFCFVFIANLFQYSRLCSDHLDTFHVHSMHVYHWSWSYIATTECTHAMQSCHHRGRYVFNHSATREDDVFDQNVIWTWQFSPFTIWAHSQFPTTSDTTNLRW